MKSDYNVFVILVLVLFLSLLSSSTSARLLLQAEKVQDGLKLTDGADLPKPQAIEEEFSSLMGSDEEERCDDEKDAEECVKRRMMGEAHLDYIYTQHHKP